MEQKNVNKEQSKGNLFIQLNHRNMAFSPILCYNRFSNPLCSLVSQRRKGNMGISPFQEASSLCAAAAWHSTASSASCIVATQLHAKAGMVRAMVNGLLLIPAAKQKWWAGKEIVCSQPLEAQSWKQIRTETCSMGRILYNLWKSYEAH